VVFLNRKSARLVAEDADGGYNVARPLPPSMGGWLSGRVLARPSTRQFGGRTTFQARKCSESRRCLPTTISLRDFWRFKNTLLISRTPPSRRVSVYSGKSAVQSQTYKLRLTHTVSHTQLFLVLYACAHNWLCLFVVLATPNMTLRELFLRTLDSFFKQSRWRFVFTYDPECLS